MTQSLVLSIDVCRGLGISPLRNKNLAEFLFWPNNCLGIIFFGFLGKFETFFLKIYAHSEQYRNLVAGIFEIQTVFDNIAFPLSRVLDR